MTPLSTRITTLDAGAGDGWSVYYRAREMEAAGQAVTYLCVGDHDFKPSDTVLDAMDRSARGHATGYAPVQGTSDLRAAIAQAQHVSPDQVAVVSGGQAGLFAALCATIDPGDKVVAIDPYYATYPSTVRAAGGRFHTAPAHAENGFQPQADDLNLAADGARALMINSPNNPTGAVYSRATLEAVAQVCAEHDLWLISDEVYETQTYGRAHLPARHVAGLGPRTITIGSFSKSHVMTGFRIGWVIARPDVITAMQSLANATTYGTPGFVQDAALAALLADQNGTDVAARYRARRDLALDVLSRSNLLAVSPPEGGMYIMADIRALCPSGEAFAHDLLRNRGIAVMPGESFGTAAAGHIRIALTQSAAVLEAALLDLVAYAEEVHRETV